MLQIQNVIKEYDVKNDVPKRILDEVSFHVEEGEFVTIFGPNGSGKSTLLNLIAGFLQPSSGQIEFDRDNERLAYIFQDYKSNLLPWKTAWKNIAQPLIWQGHDKKTAKEKVEGLVSELKLNIPLDAYPHTLSGGQSQMISILRSIVIEPTLLLADEPFSALDLANRWRLSLLLRRLWLKYKFKCVFISHDLDEAIFLGNKLILLSEMPAEIVEIYPIDLGEDRTRETLTSNEFIAIKNKILAKILELNH